MNYTIIKSEGQYKLGKYTHKGEDVAYEVSYPTTGTKEMIIRSRHRATAERDFDSALIAALQQEGVI